MKMKKILVLLLVLALLLVTSCAKTEKENLPAETTAAKTQDPTPTQTSGASPGTAAGTSLGKLTFEEAMAKAKVDSGASIDLSEKAIYDKQAYDSLPISKEGTTLQVLFPRNVLHGDFETMWGIQKLKEKTGITLKITAIESAVWDEKKNLALATGDYPDIFLTGLTPNDASLFGSQGILIDMSELIEKNAPVVKYILSKAPDVKKSITAPDGCIYYVPAISFATVDTTGAYRIFVNVKWVEKLGLTIPATLDELYNLMVAVRDGDPNGNNQADEIPLSLRYEDGFKFNGILSAFGYASAKYDVIDGKFVYVPADKNFRPYIEFMHKIYKEGLLDSEYFTQTQEQLTAKMQAGRLLFLPDGTPPYSVRTEEKDWKEYQGLWRPLTSEYNNSIVWPANTQDYGQSYAITNKCKDPVLAVKFLNYLFTDEATVINKWGPALGEAEGYEDGGWEWDEAAGMYNLHTGGFSNWGAFRMATSLQTAPQVLGGGNTYAIFAKNPQNSWIHALVYQSGIADISRFAFPNIIYTSDEQVLLSTFVDLDSYVSQTVAKFISGSLEINDANWDNFIKTMERLNLAELKSLQQKAYDRWMKN